MLLIVAAVGVGQRSAGSATEPSPGQRHPPIVPQRLHGALLERHPRRPGGAQLPAAARVEPFSALPAGGERDQGAGCRRQRQGQSAARKEPQTGRRSGGNGCARSACARPRSQRGAVEEGAACSRGPRLRRRLPHDCHGIRPGTGAAADCLKRNAATLSPACQHALAGVAAAKSKLAAAPAAAAAAAPAAARRRRTCASRAAAAARFAARGNVHPAHVLPSRLRPILSWASFRRRPGRIMSALQRGQPVAAVPGGARRAARRPLSRSLTKHKRGRYRCRGRVGGALPNSKFMQHDADLGRQ